VYFDAPTAFFGHPCHFSHAVRSRRGCRKSTLIAEDFYRYYNIGTIAMEPLLNYAVLTGCQGGPSPCAFSTTSSRVSPFTRRRVAPPLCAAPLTSCCISLAGLCSGPRLCAFRPNLCAGCPHLGPFGLGLHRHVSRPHSRRAP
jgi:hypothetical protein